MKFQLLFESGLHAFVDGYFREAVSSIWAGLERFYEFASKVIVYSMGISSESFDETIKEMKNASERQLGSFYSLYHVKFKKKLCFLDQEKDFGFRNKVIHKGYFPNESETAAFIFRIYDHIWMIIEMLSKKDIFHVYTNEQEKRANITVEGVQDTLFSTTPCVINLLCSNETDKLIKSDLKTQILKIKNEKHNSEAL